MAGKRGVRKPRRKCKIYYPTVEALLYAVEKLRRAYPEDHIHIASKAALERAIESARAAAGYTPGSCMDKKLSAAATLFYEIVAGHPLTDGNKRLATLVLKAFLLRNGLRRPVAYRAAIKVASGEWSLEDVYKWLRRVHKGG